MQSARYYEAHITVQAAEEVQWDHFAATARKYGWKASKFDEDEVDDMSGMWFLSARHPSYEFIASDIVDQIHLLNLTGFIVLRYKIEDTLLDSKLGDTLEGLENILKD